MSWHFCPHVSRHTQITIIYFLNYQIFFGKVTTTCHNLNSQGTKLRGPIPNVTICLAMLFIFIVLFLFFRDKANLRGPTNNSSKYAWDKNTGSNIPLLIQISADLFQECTDSSIG